MKKKIVIMCLVSACLIFTFKFTIKGEPPQPSPCFKWTLEQWNGYMEGLGEASCYCSREGPDYFWGYVSICYPYPDPNVQCWSNTCTQSMCCYTINP